MGADVRRMFSLLEIFGCNMLIHFKSQHLMKARPNPSKPWLNKVHVFVVPWGARASGSQAKGSYACMRVAFVTVSMSSSSDSPHV